VFQPNRHTDQILGDTGSLLLGVSELLVCGGGGVYDQGAGVTDVGEMGSEAEVVDEFGACGGTTFDADCLS
jgi:hypothetical protein